MEAERLAVDQGHSGGVGEWPKLSLEVREAQAEGLWGGHLRVQQAQDSERAG